VQQGPAADLNLDELSLRSRARHALVREQPRSRVKNAAKYLCWAAEMRLAALLLRERARGLNGIDETLDLIENFRLGHVRIKAWQVRSELASLLAVVRNEQPRTILEIGTALGGTLFGFAQVAAPDAVLVTVDLPRGRFGGDYYNPARNYLYPRFARAQQTIHLVLGDSHEAETRARVDELIGRRQVDFLFIDGDHSYEGICADYELYRPLVRPGGLVAFHDIVPGNKELVGDVPDFWRDFKASHETTEFVESYDQEGYGIGLLRVSGPTRLHRGLGT
jgi:predicted O-methyltransferase YrrM